MLSFGLAWQFVETPNSTLLNLSKRKLFLLNLRKTHLSTLVRVLTGHWRFNLHMSRMGLSIERMCPLCDSDYDTHFICLCPYNAFRRHELFGNFILSANENNRLDLKTILSFRIAGSISLGHR